MNRKVVFMDKLRNKGQFNVKQNIQLLLCFVFVRVKDGSGTDWTSRRVGVWLNQGTWCLNHLYVSSEDWGNYIYLPYTRFFLRDIINFCLTLPHNFSRILHRNSLILHEILLSLFLRDT